VNGYFCPYTKIEKYLAADPSYNLADFRLRHWTRRSSYSVDISVDIIVPEYKGEVRSPVGVARLYLGDRITAFAN
jgi:hypothetical protein